jgi:eukaryotic-like serine/threonine-protein kinase
VGSRSSDVTIETTGVVSTPKPVSSLELGSAETMPASGGHRVLEDARISRFTVKHVLGRGGMGEVWAAYDPDLDRMVAIKLLRPELSTTRADARLRREARSMAKLSHGNLVTVHDVGVHDGQLFVAMELIDGGTLRGWQRGRRWREIVGAYVAAGRGLAAAHAADIVHRDFKPDNVLVGRDGRVAVGDFGLAMSSDEDTPLTAAEVHLTQAGALVGTLHYMAPEQLDRHVADARSDQFAFCLSLWEALDADPFGEMKSSDDAGVVADARRRAIASGPPRKIAGVPARITKALARGLSVLPGDRWPSMTELLRAIEPNRRRNRIAVASFVLGTAAIAVGATWWARSPAADPCADVASPMAGVWIPGSAHRLQTAFAATKHPNAAETATRTAAILDRRAAAWTVMRVESCQATARGEQAADLDQRRTRCLDARRTELATLVTALTTSPTTDMVDAAVRAVNGLPPIEQCSNVSALLERVPPAATLRGPIAQLELDVARADTLEKLGDKAVIAELPALRQRALELEWAPALARIDSTIGHEAWRRGDSAAAIEPLREAATAAERAKDDELGARVTSLEAEALVEADRASDALEVAHSSELLAARAGDPADTRADALEALAIAYRGLAKFDDADKAYASAAALLEHGPDRMHLAIVLNSIATLRFDRSDYAGALPFSERAVGLIRSELGEHHPDYARALHSYANLLVYAHRYPEAKQDFEQALAIKEADYGPESPTVAMTVNSLGNVAEMTGDLEEAGKLYQRAYDIWAKTLGPDHSNALMARYNVGVNFHHRKKLKEAIAALSDVLARRTALKLPQPQKLANTLDALAATYFDAGDNKKALDLATQALAIREKVLGPNTDDAAESHTMVAEIEQAMGNCGKAVADAKHAIEVLKGEPGGEGDMGLPTLLLARCAHGGDARPLYEKALALLPTDGEAASELAEAKAWLAAHPK